MARNAKLDRLLTLVKALEESAEGLTLDEMAAIFSRLDADLRQLARAGIAEWQPDDEDRADA